MKIKQGFAELILAFLLVTALKTQAQSEKPNTFFRPSPPNYDVAKALELEAVPIFYFSGGYHISLGYRFNKFRIRLSTVSSGTYDEEVENPDQFKRTEKDGSIGLFLGYFPWKNLETYAFLDRNVLGITQKQTDENRTLTTLTPGLGVGYQFFIGRYVYLQPAVHSYFYTGTSVAFSNGENYAVTGVRLRPILRVGIRLGKKWK